MFNAKANATAARNAAFIKWKLCDRDGTLSLSNLTFMVLIVKLAITPILDWTTMVALFLTLINHNARKWFAKAQVEKSVSDQDKLVSLANDVKALANAMSFKNLSR